MQKKDLAFESSPKKRFPPSELAARNLLRRRLAKLGLRGTWCSTTSSSKNNTNDSNNYHNRNTHISIRIISLVILLIVSVPIMIQTSHCRYSYIIF